MKKKIRPTLIFLGATALVLGAAPLRADDVTDSIDEASKAYKEGDYNTAAQSLDTAAQLVRQKRADIFKEFLPQPPSGWSGEEEATTQASGAAMFGGGVTAEREYTKGDSRMTVKIVTDSPMMQSMMMLMSNPMFANSDGGKLEKIKGQKGIFKNKGGSGSFNIVVGGTLLIQIEGNDVTDADLRAFAEGIDYAKLASKI